MNQHFIHKLFIQYSLRIISFVVIPLLITSCISLRYNYLGGYRKQGVNNILNVDYLPYYENQKERINLRAYSLIQTITDKFKTRDYIGAADLNQLYENFGAQLNNDRYFNLLLKKGRLHRDSLTSLQRYAATRLLLSAYNYHILYQNNQTIRRALNRGDVGNNIPKNALQKSNYFLNATSIRKILAKGRPNDGFPTDSILRKIPKINKLQSVFHYFFQKNDRIHTFQYSFFHFIGKSFFASNSNSVKKTGNNKIAAQLLSLVQPYDIIVEKSHDYMANQVIPGYFTHSSIWLGIKNRHKYTYNPNKLIKPPLWNITVNDRSMGEAVTSGVRLSNLIEFAYGKSFAIIRMRKLSDEQKKQILSNTLKQLKKSYDFNFNIESSDMINCTELIYLAYDFIDWKKHYFMGRYTVYPDDIIQTALHDERLEIVAFIENDTLVQHPDSSLIQALL